MERTKVAVVLGLVFISAGLSFQFHSSVAKKNRILKPFAATSMMIRPSLPNFRTTIAFLESPIIISVAKSSLKRYVNPIISGGLLSGSLHAITGPDHLAALLPPSVGQRWWHGMRIGAIWGLGHGISATFLGLCAFLLKDRISSQFNFLHRISGFADIAVGLSLFLIGLIGIKEAAELKNVTPSENETDESLTAPKSSAAIFANGILHGFSWDGAPSLAPALAMTSMKSCLSFFLSYCLGTITAMSVVAGGVGEGSVRLGKIVNNPDLPRKLSMASSLLAVVIGLFWIFQALS